MPGSTSHHLKKAGTRRVDAHTNRTTDGATSRSWADHFGFRPPLRVEWLHWLAVRRNRAGGDHSGGRLERRTLRTRDCVLDFRRLLFQWPDYADVELALPSAADFLLDH